MSFYIVMVVRSLLAGSNRVLEFNSKEIDKESKKIIELLKEDKEDIKDAFIIGKGIVSSAISEYRKSNNQIRLNNIFKRFT